MPYSSDEGKAMVKEFMQDKDLLDILDVGPGAGTYFYLLDDDHPTANWTAIEIWAPYIEQFGLKAKYDHIIVGDAIWVDWNRLGFYDLIILGDVLEHMTAGDANFVLERSVDSARFVVVSLPIIDYPQGAHEGNEYETHVTSWDKEKVWSRLLDGYSVLRYYEGEVTGTYILEGVDAI